LTASAAADAPDPHPGLAIIRPTEKIVISTVSAPVAESINRQIPPNAGYAVTDTTLEKSAVAPGFSIIPLPAFQYNRNEGAWYGGLTPMFRANAEGQVEDIIAPVYLHNAGIGETFALNYFAYRNETQQFHAIVSHATKVEHQLEVGYKDTGFYDGRYIIDLQANSERTAFDRFYGFGDRASEANETNYSKGNSEIKASAGINLADSVSFLGTERVRKVALKNGVVTSVPQTLAADPNTPGIEGADIWAQSLTLAYDTRDNQLTPLQGIYATVSGESDQNYKTDNRDQWFRATADVRGYLPHAQDEAVFVTHAMFDDILNDKKGLVRQGVPFYERPTLGGEDTLRAFGDDRFISNYAILLNFEERIAIVERSVLGNLVELEIAPFLDVGRVGSRFTSDKFAQNMEIDPGIGVRLLARPNIASRLDVGYGRDGANVYVGLDYPF
jgi:hypothetical protein